MRSVPLLGKTRPLQIVAEGNVGIGAQGRHLQVAGVMMERFAWDPSPKGLVKWPTSFRKRGCPLLVRALWKQSGSHTLLW